MRWLEDVEKDRWEMKFKIWRQKVVDTEEWVSVIRGGSRLSEGHTVKK
jgi:hypothetical protein